MEHELSKLIAYIALIVTLSLAGCGALIWALKEFAEVKARVTALEAKAEAELASIKAKL